MDLPQEQNFSNSNKPKRGWLANFLLSVKIKFKKRFAHKTHGNFDRAKADKKLIYSLAPSKIPNRQQFKQLKKFLAPKENLIVKSLIAVIVISVVFIGWNFYQSHLQMAPAKGGEYSEGLVGTPKYINPLYSFSDVDSDLSYLIFSHLFKYDGQGNLNKDLVEDYSVSEDGKTYTVTLIKSAKWHNNEKLTADDVVFTFQAIKNPDFRSPWLNVFGGVEIEKIDEYSFKMILAEPYAGFLELLTFGILPEKLWMNINPENANLAELNLKPIGSGPYKFKALLKNKAGSIKEYSLEANKGYYQHEPYIEELHFKFYPDFISLVEGLNSHEVDGISYLPLDKKSDVIAQNSLNFHHFSLPQVTALFFNEEKNAVLESQELREALALAIDKNKLVEDIFGQEASVINGPVLPGSFAYNDQLPDYGFDIDKAKGLLEEAGWGLQEISSADISQAEEQAERIEIALAIDNEIKDKKNQTKDKKKSETKEGEEDEEDEEKIDEEVFEVKGLKQLQSLASSTPLVVEGSWRYKEKDNNRTYLILTLTVVDNSRNYEVAEALQAAWQKLGIRSIINSVSASEIQAKIIKPKDFEILLYGQTLGFDPDPFAYWHSQEELNITDYDNSAVDKLLEDSRVILDQEKRAEKYREFQKIIHDEIPAIFLYSPNYIYPQSKKIKGLITFSILDPKHRFSNIIDWHIKVKNKLVF